MMQKSMVRTVKYCLLALVLLAPVATSCGRSESSPIAEQTPGVTPAQEPNTYTLLDIMPAWKKGESRILNIVKGRERRKGDQVTLKTGMRSQATIEVLDADADGFLLGWTFGESVPSDPKLANDPLLSAVAGITNGLTAKIEMDPDATITRIANFEEIHTATERLIETGIVAFGKSGIDRATLNAIEQQTKSMFSSEEQVRTALLQEAMFYFLPVGRQYALGEPIQYEDLLPNPFGGDPFPSKASLSIKEYDFAARRVTIEWKQSLDSETTGAIMSDTLKRLAEKLGVAAPVESEAPPIDIQDIAEFVVDIDTGWVESLHHSRTMTTGDTVQIATLSIVAGRVKANK